MTRVLGLRDISTHETLHLLVSYELHCNITVVRMSLDKSNLLIRSEFKGKKRTSYLILKGILIIHLQKLKVN